MGDNMWYEAGEPARINSAISEVWQEKYDALKQQNAGLLAALKVVADGKEAQVQWLIDHNAHLGIGGLNTATLQRVVADKAIADAEEARKSDFHVCDVELPIEGDNHG